MTHHEECDGYIIHHVRPASAGQGMYRGICSSESCGYTTGLAGSQATIRSLAAGHEGTADCDGRCRNW
jgi:hypothetical protein